MLQRVTLRDIAEAAKVHYSTVSLALRDHPRISPAVRKKVKQIAEKMGYQPDPALSALNAYRKTRLPVHYQSTIAWIDNWHSPQRLRDQPTFEEYYQGAADRARQLGYELEEFRIEDYGASPQRVSKMLQSRGIKGLLLAPQPTSGMNLPFNYEWFSSVTFGYSLQPQVFHIVTNYQSHSMETALKKLIELGYKKIGLFLHENIDEKVENAYTTTFWHFFHKHSKMVPLRPYVIKEKEHDRTSFEKWFRKATPDVVVSIGGLSIVDWLKDMGVSVPRDVGYVRLSIANDEKYISGIYENGLLIGRTAMDFLVGMLQHGEYGFPETPIRILVEGVWKAGKTVRKQA